MIKNISRYIKLKKLVIQLVNFLRNDQIILRIKIEDSKIDSHRTKQEVIIKNLNKNGLLIIGNAILMTWSAKGIMQFELIFK